MGIEPTRPAWKAGILPLNYTRIRFRAYIYYHKVCDLSTLFLKVFLIIFTAFICSSSLCTLQRMQHGFYIFQYFYILRF